MAIAISTSVRCNSRLEKALSDIEKAGFESIDLLAIDGWVHVHTRDLVSQYDETVSRLDSLLRQHHLKPIILNTGVASQLHHRSDEINAQRTREIDALIRLMKHYDIQIAAIQPRNTDPQRPYDDVFRDCVATLQEQIAAGAAAGVIFALELHVRSPFETFEQARRLLEAMPDIPLVYDPSHFVMQGIDLRETEWLMDNARHTHLRDAAPGQLQMPFGKGAVNFDWVLQALKDRGYLGNFSIEYLETDDFDVLDSSRKLYDKIASYFPV